jgi:hypothetical protein
MILKTKLEKLTANLGTLKNNLSLLKDKLEALKLSLKTFKFVYNSSNLFSLVYSDGTEIKNIPYEVLAQSATFKSMIDDLGGIATIPAGIELPQPAGIDSKTIPIMLTFMQWAHDGTLVIDISQHQIILNLVAKMKANGFLDYKPEALATLLNATNILDLGPTYRALCWLIAQDPRQDPLKDHAFKEKILTLYNPDLVTAIKKAYFLSHHIQFNPDKPVTITLNDLIGYGLLEVEDNASPFVLSNDIAGYIRQLITTNKYVMLQATLDALSTYATSLSIQAHQELMKYVRTLNEDQLKTLFLQLGDPSTFRMALQLVFAQKFNVNLDANLDCLVFVTFIRFWVNGEYNFIHQTHLFSQPNLSYVLPLLEPLIGSPVTGLNLSIHHLISLPTSIGNLVALKWLNLSGNQLTKLPKYICKLVNLQELRLSSNNLTSLPDCIGNLINLQRFRLGLNTLSGLPDSFGNLKNLELLDLSSNKLTNLPKNIGNLINLQRLVLSLNELSSLPESFGNLKNLRELDLEYNQLTSLPDSLANSNILEIINLRWNRKANKDTIGKDTITEETKQQLRLKFGNKIRL